VAQDPPYAIEFFEEDDGRKPVLGWIKEELSRTKRQAIGAAMQHVLQVYGIDVCGTEWGKQLGDGLFEFRVRLSGSEVINKEWGTEATVDESESVLLRVFCHAFGDKLVLLLGGYDKGEGPSRKAQDKQIEIARARLKLHKQRQQEARKAARKTSGRERRS